MVHPAARPHHSIVRKAGTDVTPDFEFHQCAARKIWAHLAVGRLVRCGKEPKKRWFQFW